MSIVSEPFAAVLRQARDDFNHRFTVARRGCPQIDPAEFSSFLLASVDPLIAAVGAVRPEAVFDTVSAGYDIALELAGHGLLSPRYPEIHAAWQRVLPAAAHLVAQAPNKIIAAISNGLHHLLTTPGGRPADWIAMLTLLAPDCQDVEAFLHLGQLAAWRCGLAHYRAGALTLADGLPPGAVLSVLGEHGNLAWAELRDYLHNDPWFDPSRGARSSGTLRIASEAGAFRGFGGLFPEPPRVAVQDGHLLVASGPSCWLLTADCFGATFHRVTTTEWDQAKEGTLPRGLRLENGMLVRGKEALSLADFGPLTSKAATETTLALTTAYTHAVVLVALT